MADIIAHCQEESLSGGPSSLPREKKKKRKKKPREDKNGIEESGRSKKRSVEKVSSVQLDGEGEVRDDQTSANGEGKDTKKSTKRRKKHHQKESDSMIPATNSTAKGKSLPNQKAQLSEIDADKQVSVLRALQSKVYGSFTRISIKMQELCVQKRTLHGLRKLLSELLIQADESGFRDPRDMVSMIASGSSGNRFKESGLILSEVCSSSVCYTNLLRTSTRAAVNSRNQSLSSVSSRQQHSKKSYRLGILASKSSSIRTDGVSPSPGSADREHMTGM